MSKVFQKQSSKFSEYLRNTIFGLILLGLLTNFVYDRIKHDTTEETVQTTSKITHEKLNKIDQLLQELPEHSNKGELQKFFGDDWESVLQNPYIFTKLKEQLSEQNQTIEKLMKEHDRLKTEINQLNSKPKLQQTLDRALNELRYDDVKTILNETQQENNAPTIDQTLNLKTDIISEEDSLLGNAQVKKLKLLKSVNSIHKQLSNFYKNLDYKAQKAIVSPQSDGTYNITIPINWTSDSNKIKKIFF